MVERVGPGQRNHDISDGCVPSHTSHLDAARAETRSLRAQLDARHQEIYTLEDRLAAAQAVVDAARIASRAQGRVGYGKAMATLTDALQALDHS